MMEEPTMHLMHIIRLSTHLNNQAQVPNKEETLSELYHLSEHPKWQTEQDRVPRDPTENFLPIPSSYPKGFKIYIYVAHYYINQKILLS